MIQANARWDVPQISGGEDEPPVTYRADRKADVVPTYPAGVSVRIDFREESYDDYTLGNTANWTVTIEVAGVYQISQWSAWQLTVTEAASFRDQWVEVNGAVLHGLIFSRRAMHSSSTLCPCIPIHAITYLEVGDTINCWQRHFAGGDIAPDLDPFFSVTFLGL